MITTVPQVLERGIELPPLVVLGAGNTLDNGIALGSVINAEAAAAVLHEGLATRDLVITTGRGPDTQAVYPISEARGMAAIIADRVGSDINIEMDEEAQDTIANVSGVERLLKGYCVGEIAVLGAVLHTGRFKLIAERHLPKLSITEVHTIPRVATRTKIREFGQSMLYKTVTFGLVENDTRLAVREEMYRKAVAIPKKLAMSRAVSLKYGKTA